VPYSGPSKNQRHVLICIKLMACLYECVPYFSTLIMLPVSFSLINYGSITDSLRRYLTTDWRVKV
jgi:hypothetical protein